MKKEMVYICEHCNSKNQTKESAVKCEERCLKDKKKSCSLCCFCRDKEHVRLHSPVTKRRRSLKYRYLWQEKYCLRMLFYERFQARSKHISYRNILNKSWGRRNLILTKDYRKGKTGVYCNLFKENDNES